jgi:hypothetical protein
MKIEKFEKFFESVDRILTPGDLEDLCVSLQDSTKGFADVSIDLFYEMSNGWIETIDDFLDYNDKIGKFGLKIMIYYKKIKKSDDIIEGINYFSEMYSELSNILRIIKSMYSISDINGLSTDGELLEIYIFLPKSEYYQKYFSNYLLEGLLHDYSPLLTDIKNYNSGKDTFVEVKKQLDFIDRKDFDKNIIEDQVYSQFGKRFVEFELEETKDSYIFKNFKIKNIFT